MIAGSAERRDGVPAASSKITPRHLERLGIVYVRQSHYMQSINHPESTRVQYSLTDHAVALGWPRERVLVIDEDLDTQMVGTAFHSTGSFIVLRLQLVGEIPVRKRAAQAAASVTSDPASGVQATNFSMKDDARVARTFVSRASTSLPPLGFFIVPSGTYILTARNSALCRNTVATHEAVLAGLTPRTFRNALPASIPLSRVFLT